MDSFCGKCYSPSESWSFPFGFCRPCWVSNGSPRPMNWTDEKYQQEKDNIGAPQ